MRRELKQGDVVILEFSESVTVQVEGPDSERLTRPAASSDSTAFRSTLQPAVMSFGDAYSASLCERPSWQGMKIIAVGATLETGRRSRGRRR